MLDLAGRLRWLLTLHHGDGASVSVDVSSRGLLLGHSLGRWGDSAGHLGSSACLAGECSGSDHQGGSGCDRQRISEPVSEWLDFLDLLYSAVVTVSVSRVTVFQAVDVAGAICRLKSLGS